MFHVEHRNSMEIVLADDELFHVERFPTAWKQGSEHCSTWN